jgi:peroxiredoxin
VQAELKELQADRHQQVLAQLDGRQQTLYGQLLGEPFNFAQVRPSPADAPEFEGINTWLNSEPLTMKSLRGQVVVVHFFAFGCINCIHNYPWYREWQNELADKDVTIIGIHTPETQAETDVEQLRLSLEKHELKFPVAVDADKKMWQAWYNGIWPSVYLIDRQGRVRYWWYGELDWQGAGNQKITRKQIEQLLAEKATAPTK